MQFFEPKDFDLLQKLFNSQTLSMSQFQKWDKPEEGSLMETVKANRHSVEDGIWIKNVIKELKVTRFNSPHIDPSIYSQLQIDPESIVSIIRSGVYPLMIMGNDLWVGIVRPDTNLEQVKSTFPGFGHIFFCALSPRESHELDEAMLKYAKQVLKWMMPPGTIR